MMTMTMMLVLPRLPGMLMDRLMSLLKEKDTALWLKLHQQDLKPQYYGFRWIMLLLSQEFPLPGTSPFLSLSLVCLPFLCSPWYVSHSFPALVCLAFCPSPWYIFYSFSLPGMFPIPSLCLVYLPFLPSP